MTTVAELLLSQDRETLQRMSDLLRAALDAVAPPCGDTGRSGGAWKIEVRERVLMPCSQRWIAWLVDEDETCPSARMVASGEGPNKQAALYELEHAIGQKRWWNGRERYYAALMSVRAAIRAAGG